MIALMLAYVKINIGGHLFFEQLASVSVRGPKTLWWFLDAS